MQNTSGIESIIIFFKLTILQDKFVRIKEQNQMLNNGKDGKKSEFYEL